MTDKIYIAILSGGPSSEHEVSLKSGEMVKEGLDKERYEPIPVRIHKDGTWELEPKDVQKNAAGVFVAMHGTYGEDGTVQSILEAQGIPYTGSDSFASALGMNKFISLRLFRDGGLSVPASILLTQREWKKDAATLERRVAHHIGFPLVIKPNNQGSSVGVHIVKRKEDLREAFAHTLGFYREVLAQEFIEGREFTCGVLDHGWSGSAFPLLPTEIVPRVSDFFDYKAKYEEGGSLEITPPENLTAQEMKKVRNAALHAHFLIGASGFSRTDMIMDKKGTVYVLEINTIPGLTKESLIPKAAAASGMSFSDLLDTIVHAGFTRWRRK